MSIRAKLSVGGILALFGAACSSPSLTFQSVPPQAEIFAGKLGEKAKPVGATPLTVKASDFAKANDLIGPVLIEFRKDGYTTGKVVVSDLTAGELTVNFELVASTGLEDPEKLNAVQELLFEGQRLARINRYDDALGKLKQVETLAPQLAATYEIEGGIYYLQKKYKDALDSYSSAVRRNPKNYQSIKMKAALRKLLGLKADATPTPEASPAPEKKK